MGHRAWHEVLGNTVGGVKRDKNVFVKAQKWVQLLFISCFQKTTL